MKKMKPKAKPKKAPTKGSARLNVLRKNMNQLPVPKGAY